MYVVCYKENGSRIYISEKEIDNQIVSILNQITVPKEMLKHFREHIRDAKQAEINFRNQEIGRLKAELTKIEKRSEKLFNMRLDEEIDKQTYEDKRDELNLKRSRIEGEIKAHGVADDGFNEIVLDILDLVCHIGDTYAKGKSKENKRLLLRFLFKKLVLKEGNVGYELNPPFSYMDSSVYSQGSKGNENTESCEPKENQGVKGDLGGNSKKTQNAPFEPKNIVKNQEVRQENLTSVQFGWAGWIRTNE